MKKIVLLGASGSIGMQTIDVVTDHPEEFEIVAFSAGRNMTNVRKILSRISCKEVCVQFYDDAEQLSREYPDIRFCYGDEGLLHLTELDGYDVLVNALVGFAGLRPTLNAISHKKDIALANKETLVVAGAIVTKACADNGVRLLPIDSEHSAILQCLQGNEEKEVDRLIITASGGSFRDRTRDELKDVTVEQALAHPNWSMGPKITIDSATMMNKGFEVIEAHWLFNIPFDRIDVVIHKESVIHSMVQYRDSSVIAQLAGPNMRLPISYALSYPHRLEVTQSEPLNFARIGMLHFAAPDMERFPLLKIAYEVGTKQGNLPAVLNAANEVANEAFREGKISFLAIEELIIDCLEHASFKEEITLEDIFEADEWARAYVEKKVNA